MWKTVLTDDAPYESALPYMGCCPLSSLAFTLFRAHGSYFSQGNRTPHATFLEGGGGGEACLACLDDEMELICTFWFVSTLKIVKEKIQELKRLPQKAYRRNKLPIALDQRLHHVTVEGLEISFEGKHKLSHRN